MCVILGRCSVRMIIIVIAQTSYELYIPHLSHQSAFHFELQKETALSHTFVSISDDITMYVNSGKQKVRESSD